MKAIRLIVGIREAFLERIRRVLPLCLRPAVPPASLLNRLSDTLVQGIGERVVRLVFRHGEIYFIGLTTADVARAELFSREGEKYVKV